MDHQLFNGMPVVLSAWMTEAGEPYQARRSWRDRLFSRPWRPFRATVTIVPQVPRRDVLMFDNKLLMHPVAFRELKREIERRAAPADQKE